MTVHGSPSPRSTRVVSRALLAAVLGLTFAAAGCATHVAAIDLRDPRLPPAARSWLADADDTVTVARIGVDEALAARAHTVRWRSRMEGKLEWPAGDKASQAKSTLAAFANARQALSDAHVASARAALDLAMAKRDKMRAETALRHDLAVYDLVPLRKAVADKRAALADTETRVADARQALDETQAAFWNAYGAYVKDGGDRRVLWREVAR